MNTNDLIRKVETGKTVSLKESVLALFIGCGDGLASDEKLNEALIELRSRIDELKDELKDLESGKPAEELMKKYFRPRYDCWSKKHKFLRWVISHHEVLSIGRVVDQILDVPCFPGDIEWRDAKTWLEHRKLIVRSDILIFEARIIQITNDSAVLFSAQSKLMEIIESLPNDSFTA